MKNKLLFIFLGILVIPAAIHNSDTDSPIDNGPAVPHLTRKNFLPMRQPMAPVVQPQLHQIVKTNNLDLVETALLNTNDVNEADPFGETALITAIRNRCQLPIIQALICTGADVNKYTNDGTTPLYAAVSLYPLESARIAYVKVLLTAGATTNFHQNALTHIIAENDDSDIYKMLMEAKVGINPPSYIDSTPLRHAILRNRIDRVQDLLAAGAQLDQRKNGDSELMIAVRKKNLPIARVLVDAGANVNAPGGDISVLHMAKYNKNTEMIDFLSSKGAVTFWGDGGGCRIQ
jgi:uncharacterized protein